MCKFALALSFYKMFKICEKDKVLLLNIIPIEKNDVLSPEIFRLFSSMRFNEADTGI